MWRAGLPALGRAAAPAILTRCVSQPRVSGVGAAAQPNAGKPARHEKPVSNKKPVSPESLLATTGLLGTVSRGVGNAGDLWREGLLWRAGLPALGCEAAPERLMRCVSQPRVPGFGAAAQPNAGKPARHQKPARHKMCFTIDFVFVRGHCFLAHRQLPRHNRGNQKDEKHRDRPLEKLLLIFPKRHLRAVHQQEQPRHRRARIPQRLAHE